MVLVSPTYLRNTTFHCPTALSVQIDPLMPQCEQEAAPYRNRDAFLVLRGKNRKVYCFVAYSDDSVSAHVLFTLREPSVVFLPL